MEYDYNFGNNYYKYYGNKGIKSIVYNIMAPEQSQDVQPGMEYVMKPLPIFDNPNYKGSGKLKAKVAIVTGGDSGLGRACSIAFIKEGHTPDENNINGAQNMKTTSDENVTLWEPNYDVHTEHGVANARRTYGIDTTRTNAEIIKYDGVIGTVTNSALVEVGSANSTNYPNLFEGVNIDSFLK